MATHEPLTSGGAARRRVFYRLVVLVTLFQPILAIIPIFTNPAHVRYIGAKLTSRLNEKM
jgi:hypothetical protein